ncbi:phosphoenolpyruvate-dependent sugar phosphotransferase system, EIIA 1 [Pseudidiomarina planktonica]|uniref:Phosphoenolpyruvate-dependent sugar phosphotransferase system, EIIA 1 n=2 Tax=Pseudidiomarina planktonica TaxID=1323738 RepID=A0A1Y6F0K1_9GAMM|nr:phosphoenolpyruvate-dependent sugar phosphotransferase system, EIIA 1 [Pseudidiomarina planktonica]
MPDHDICIAAPAHGRKQPLVHHPDSVVQQQVLGSGLSLQVHGNELVAPASGLLKYVSPAGHYWHFLLPHASPASCGSKKFENCVLLFADPAFSTHLPGITKQPKLGQKIRAGTLLARLHLPVLQANLGHTALAIVFPDRSANEIDWQPGSARCNEQPFIKISLSAQQ